MAPVNNSAPAATVRQYRAAQATERASKRPAQIERGCSVPSAYVAAPGAFQRQGHSLERLRHAWGVSRREALEAVLAGLCEAVYGPAPNTGRSRVIEMARRAA